MCLARLSTIHCLGYCSGPELWDMYFVCASGDELYDCVDEELVWVVKL